MNNLFKDIAKDAGIRIVPVIETSPPSGIECTIADLEKFAELLIRECSSLAYDGPGGVLEHFGIDDGLTN